MGRTMQNLKVVFHWEVDTMLRDRCYKVELFWEGKLIFTKKFDPHISKDSRKLLIHNLLKDCYRAHFDE